MISNTNLLRPDTNLLHPTHIKYEFESHRMAQSHYTLIAKQHSINSDVACVRACVYVDMIYTQKEETYIDEVL